MRWASKTFSIEKSDAGIPSKNSSLSTRVFRRHAWLGLLDRQYYISNSTRKPDFISDRKPEFSIHVADGVRIRLQIMRVFFLVLT